LSASKPPLGKAFLIAAASWGLIADSLVAGLLGVAKVLK
jgi:hypothetical protein